MKDQLSITLFNLSREVYKQQEPGKIYATNVTRELLQVIQKDFPQQIFQKAPKIAPRTCQRLLSMMGKPPSSRLETYTKMTPKLFTKVTKAIPESSQHGSQTFPSMTYH